MRIYLFKQAFAAALSVRAPKVPSYDSRLIDFLSYYVCHHRQRRIQYRRQRSSQLCTVVGGCERCCDELLQCLGKTTPRGSFSCAFRVGSLIGGNKLRAFGGDTEYALGKGREL